MTRNPQRNDLRVLLAQEAARVIGEEGVRDYQLAKRKAASRLGVRDLHGNLPTNGEIEAALVERQRIFGGAAHDGNLRRLRGAALDAMRWFAPFEPRLVGPVLVGTATPHTDVQLHVFCDSTERIARAPQRLSRSGWRACLGMCGIRAGSPKSSFAGYPPPPRHSRVAHTAASGICSANCSAWIRPTLESAAITNWRSRRLIRAPPAPVGRPDFRAGTFPSPTSR